MSARPLPTEILLDIFKSSSAKDVFMCRGVCRHWRDVVDGLGEDFWKDRCVHDHHYVHKVYENSRLSWRELYKSLYLWSKIDAADLKVTKFPADNVQNFQLLPDGVIAVLQNHSDNQSSVKGYSDTIVYYDVETLEELNRQSFNFHFSSYQENEKLITVVDEKGTLLVIPKETKEIFSVGILYNAEPALVGDYSLFETAVYYQNDEDQMCFAKLKTMKNGKIIVKNYDLDEFYGAIIVAFSYFNDKTVFILSSETFTNIIYHYDGEFSIFSGINSYTKEIKNELMCYGFDWTEPKILQWLLDSFDRKTSNVSKVKIASLCHLGMTFLLGTKSGKINIYWYPYTPDGKLKLYDAKPIREIHHDTFENAAKEIKKVDVFEVSNGHKVFALKGYKLYILDFQQRDQDKGDCYEKHGVNDALEGVQDHKKKVS